MRGEREEVREERKGEREEKGRRRSTESREGAGTRRARQRLRRGSMTLVLLLQHKMRRQVDMYFSMVRLSACCAPFDSLSTSFSTTTRKYI